MGEENREFLRHTKNYLTGEAVAGLLSFATIPILTRLLSTDEYGALAIFLSVVSIATILMELNFRGALSRYWFEQDKEFPDFLSSNLLFLAAVTALNLGWIWLARRQLGAFFNIDPELVFLGVLCAAIRLPWHLNWRLLVAQKRSGRFATLQTIRAAGIFLIGVTWVYLLSRDRYMGQVWTYLFVEGALALVVGHALLSQARGGHLKLRHIRYSLAFGLPLLPHALSAYVLAFFDRVIVNQLEGQSATGIYSLAYDVGRVMQMIVAAMNQAWVPIFFERLERGDHAAIERMAAVNSKYVYAIALVLIVFSPELVQLMAGPAFVEALPLVPVIVMSYAAVYLYTLYTNYAFFTKRTWLVSMATLIAGFANIGLNYWLIPLWGYPAAAWTTWASYLLLFALHYVSARFILRQPVLRLRRVLPWYLVCSAFCLGLIWAQTMTGTSWLALVAVKLPLAAAVGALLLWLRGRGRGRTEEEEEER